MRAGLVALLVTLAAVAGGCSQDSRDPAAPTTAAPSSDVPTATPTPTPTPTTLAEARVLAEPAVARVTVTSWRTFVEDEDTGELLDECSVSTGTAFAVSPHLLVTAAHVVEDSDRVRVTAGRVTASGEVVGYDRRKDVALIRIEPEAPGVLAFGDEPADVGDEVATLGYADGFGLSYLTGAVNRVNRKANVGGHFMTGLTEVDFASRGGNSGGPVFDESGSVVGIHVAGPSVPAAGGRLVVPSGTAAPLVDDWRAEPDTGDLAPTSCPLLPNQGVNAGTEVDDAHPGSVHSAALSMQTYVQGINSGDYRTAYAQLVTGPTYDEFVDGVETSRISELEYEVVASAGDPVIDVDFTTSQDRGEGPADRADEECTMWHLRYTFAGRDDLWLIDKATATPGEPLNEPCPEYGD